MTADISRNQARRKFERRASKLVPRRKAVKRVKRPTPTTDLGREVLSQVLPDLLAFMVSDAAPPPYEWLAPFLDQIKLEERALVALASLMGQLDKGLKWEDESARMKLNLAMGRQLRDKLEMNDLQQRDKGAHGRIMQADNKHRALALFRRHGEADPRFKWTDPQCVDAGIWLHDCAVRGLPHLFDIVEKRIRGQKGKDKVYRYPQYSHAYNELINRLREELIERNPVYQPLREPPQPWTNWDIGGGPIRSTFVRDPHPGTEKAIREAFAGSFPHADGVNNLQSVAWRINEPGWKMVRRFAGLARDDRVGKKVSAEQVLRDLATAKLLMGAPFWVPGNTDFRGRLYGVPHFNFLREDHVRSRFLFDQGMRVDDPIWLQIHLANCFDADAGDGVKITKRPWNRRLDWTQSNLSDIVCTARNPEDTVDWWRKADAPFSFVAACMEWDAYSKDPKQHRTHLPITVDATCNGVQHLAVMANDRKTAALVGLSEIVHLASTRPPKDTGEKVAWPFPHTDTSPYAWAIVTPGAAKERFPTFPTFTGSLPDAYLLILDMVKAAIGADDTHLEKGKRVPGPPPSALFWLDQNRLNRKLIKRPAGTFGYSVTVEGMIEQIAEEYAGQHGGAEPTDPAARYLANRIMAACREVFGGPAEIMDFICALASHLADHSLPLRWITPTGFPFPIGIIRRGSCRLTISYMVIGRDF